MDAQTTQLALTNAESQRPLANFTVRVLKAVQKLGLKIIFTVYDYSVLGLLFRVESFNLYTACNSCPNDFCSCRNYQENPDYIACEEKYDLIYRNCMFDCDHNDNVCYADCNRQYDENIQNCPCKPNCPDGCPCPSYECPETTADVTTTVTTTTIAQQSNSSVLLLSSSGSWKPAKGLKYRIINNRIIPLE